MSILFGLLEKKIMIQRIDVKIPFSVDNKLAEAYNTALRESCTDWVLFLDHDVFLCNPLWYEICLTTVNSLSCIDPKAALVGCASGGSRHKGHMRENGDPVANIESHIIISKQRYHKHANELVQIEQHVAGYFMLLNRKIAMEVGFKQINKTINNIDRDFGTRVLEAGYTIYHLPGLYVYHRRGMKHLQGGFRKALR